MTLKITTPIPEIIVETQRPVWRSMVRGFKSRCPNCGQGKLFASFAQSNERCSVCAEEFHHHRADDLPAYLVIFIVGHVVVAGYLATELLVTWSSWQHLAVWLPVTFFVSIALLQPLKGAVIGLQWALRMHGFGGTDDHVGEI